MPSHSRLQARAASPARRAALTTTLVCLTALFLLRPAQAWAAGFFLPGHGVKPMGRGGAFTVSGEGDLNSLWHNPANLAGLDGLTLTVDLNLITLDFEFARAPRTLDNGETITYAPVSNEAPPLPNPQILIGGKLPKLDKTTWAFGLYAPYTAPVTFPEQGAQRYTLIDNNGSLLAYLHFAVAHEFGDSIRVGAGVQNLLGDFTLVTTSSAYTGLYGDPEDADQDLLTRIRMVDLFSPTGNLGVWVKVAPVLEAALSMQLPVNIRDKDAQLDIKLPDSALFANARVNGDSIDAGLKFPFMARAGLRLVLERLDFEVALVYENWGAVKQVTAVPNDVTVENVPGIGTIEAAPTNVPLNYRDTFSVRNGGELRLNESVRLRAGYAFESSVAPDEYYSVFLPDSTKHLITLGGTYRFANKLAIDAGFGYLHMPDRHITNSQVRQINPTDPEGENTIIVGNGDYSQRYIMGGLGVTKQF